MTPSPRLFRNMEIRVVVISAQEVLSIPKCPYCREILKLSDIKTKDGNGIFEFLCKKFYLQKFGIYALDKLKLGFEVGLGISLKNVTFVGYL